MGELGHEIICSCKKRNGHFILDQVARRNRAVILIVDYIRPQKGQPGICRLVLNANGGKLSEHVGNITARLPVIHILVLHDNLPIFMQDHLELQRRVPAVASNKTEVIPLDHMITVRGFTKRLKENIACALIGHQVIPEYRNQVGHF